MNPGWKGSKEPKRVQENKIRGIIFHICYEADTPTSNFSLNVRQQGQVLDNYKYLSDAEK